MPFSPEGIHDIQEDRETVPLGERNLPVESLPIRLVVPRQVAFNERRESIKGPEIFTIGATSTFAAESREQPELNPCSSRRWKNHSASVLLRSIAIDQGESPLTRKGRWNWSTKYRPFPEMPLTKGLAVADCGDCAVLPDGRPPSVGGTTTGDDREAAAVEVGGRGSAATSAVFADVQPDSATAAAIIATAVNIRRAPARLDPHDINTVSSSLSTDRTCHGTRRFDSRYVAVPPAWSGARYAAACNRKRSAYW